MKRALQACSRRLPRTTIAALVGVMVSVVASQSAAQERLYVVQGPPGDSSFGSTVERIGDVDLDTYPDLLASSATHTQILSGRDGSLIMQVAGSSPCAVGDLNRDGIEDFVVRGVAGIDVIVSPAWNVAFTLPDGVCYAGAGDVNRDGHQDVVIGAVAGTRDVHVYSGRDGTLLHSWAAPPNTPQFGAAVSSAGDVDADGFADVIIGSPLLSSNDGRAFVYSGRTGANLFSIQGTSSRSFAACVGCVGDVNLDGHDDFAVSSPGFSSNIPWEARCVHLFSGVDGSLLREVHAGSVFFGGTASGYESSFGRSLQAVDDLDADGVPDLAIWSDYRMLVASGVDGSTLFETKRAGRMLHDLTKDGVPDFASGGLGAVSVYSGPDLRTIHKYQFSLLGTTDPPGTPLDATALQDMDGDGVGDFAIALQGYSTYAGGTSGINVYSGSSGLLLTRFDAGPQFDDTQVAVADGGDIDGDGRPDLITSHFGTDRPGYGVSVFAKDGARIHHFPNAAYESDYGKTLAGGVDWNGDGKDDVVIGFPSGGPQGEGVVEVRSGADGNVLHVLLGGAAGDGFGAALAYVEDTDGDGRKELLVGSPSADVASLIDAGRVDMVATANGTVMRSFTGLGASDQFGYALASVCDQDSDGAGDFIVGAPGWLAGTGSVHVLSGRDGHLLRFLQGTPGSQFGFDVSGGIDGDGDGTPDLLVGSPGSHGGAGSVTLFSGGTFSVVREAQGDGAFGQFVALLRDPIGPTRARMLAGASQGGSSWYRPTGYVRVFGVTGRGTYGLFGAGCGGQRGVPHLWGSGDVRLGGTLTIAVRYGQPLAPGVLHLGLSESQLGFARLPLHLGLIQMPGCMLLVDPVIPFPLTTNSAGSVSFPYRIPSDPQLLDLTIFNQHLLLDASANVMGIVVTNAGRFTCRY